MNETEEFCLVMFMMKYRIVTQCLRKKCAVLVLCLSCLLAASRKVWQSGTKKSVAGCQPKGLAARLKMKCGWLPAERSGSQAKNEVWLAASRKVWHPGQKKVLLAASRKVWQPAPCSLYVVGCGFCLLCPCRKADDPPEQTMDPLPSLPDLKRLVFVKDCVYSCVWLGGDCHMLS